jgi:hypothetical protein
MSGSAHPTTRRHTPKDFTVEMLYCRLQQNLGTYRANTVSSHVWAHKGTHIGRQLYSVLDELNDRISGSSP